jgi:hypothetical protein
MRSVVRSTVTGSSAAPAQPSNHQELPNIGEHAGGPQTRMAVARGGGVSDAYGHFRRRISANLPMISATPARCGSGGLAAQCGAFLRSN